MFEFRKRKNFTMKNLFYLLFIIIISGCIENLPLDEEISNYTLINQDSVNVVFPEDFKSKILVVGFIFTNCPDICPLTTNNMHLIQEKLKKENINKDVYFISISFDPEIDKPSVLKKFAEIHNLDLTNWQLCTGTQEVIKKLLKEFNVLAVQADTIYLPNNKVQYYYVHTDRISLLDQKGNLRKNYPGSKINIDEITADIKELENEQ